jgi:hypothetical protein
MMPSLARGSGPRFQADRRRSSPITEAHLRRSKARLSRLSKRIPAMDQKATILINRTQNLVVQAHGLDGCWTGLLHARVFPKEHLQIVTFPLMQPKLNLSVWAI